MAFRRQMSVLFGALTGTIVLLVFASGAWGQPSERGTERVLDKDPRDASYASGELVVTFKSNVSDRTKEALARARGGQIKKSIPEIEVSTFSFPAIKNEQARQIREQVLERVKQALERNPTVEAVDYNYLRKASYTPNDPYFSRAQYGLKKPGFPQAWDKSLGRTWARIAIIDSGIQSVHPDLRYKIAAQRDFVSNDGVAQDSDGHGTHVAGTAAARTANGIGVAGACPGCTLLVGKFLGADGSGTLSDEVEAITWAANNRAKVINMSFGGYPGATAESNALNYAYNKGAVLVAAAGNEGSSIPSYPAAYPNVLAVAATDPYDRRASYSNYGSHIDVAAPGVNIISTVSYGSGYAFYSGTSMAAPHVSGLAGLLASRGFSKYQIRNRIEGFATDLGPAGKDPYYGYGRINAARAVQ